jgi:hypothetical protein
MTFSFVRCNTAISRQFNEGTVDYELIFSASSVVVDLGEYRKAEEDVPLIQVREVMIQQGRFQLIVFLKNTPRLMNNNYYASVSIRLSATSTELQRGMGIRIRGRYSSPEVIVDEWEFTGQNLPINDPMLDRFITPSSSSTLIRRYVRSGILLG